MILDNKNMSYVAKWRWAKTVCKGLCTIKKKHVRGYEKCDKNPDPNIFGFIRHMGK